SPTSPPVRRCVQVIRSSRPPFFKRRSSAHAFQTSTPSSPTTNLRSPLTNVTLTPTAPRSINVTSRRSMPLTNIAVLITPVYFSSPSLQAHALTQPQVSHFPVFVPLLLPLAVLLPSPDLSS